MQNYQENINTIKQLSSDKSDKSDTFNTLYKHFFKDNNLYESESESESESYIDLYEKIYITPISSCVNYIAKYCNNITKNIITYNNIIIIRTFLVLLFFMRIYVLLS